jgi:nucleoredoxin
MRLLSLLLALLLTATAAAEPFPLTNKEIALMLRSGYSSESILAEIQSRRVCEALDPTTKKSILEFGASQPLIAALESGVWRTSNSAADAAKAREVEVARQRQLQIEQDHQLSTLYQARQSESRARLAAAPPPGETHVLDAVKSKLVRCQDGTISRVDGAELETKKLVALYYSAHWCGPCRKFTPQLVEYYNRVREAHPELELIFVSADRSRFGWETYIRETKMPWLAIDYDQLAEMPEVKKLGGDSIPSLLVLNSEGGVVANTYEGENYLGPQNALAALDKIFASSGGK